MRQPSLSPSRLSVFARSRAFPYRIALAGLALGLLVTACEPRILEPPVVASFAHLGEDRTVVFGEETFVRTAGPPNTAVRIFSTDGATSPFRLVVKNGTAQGAHRVTGATVRVDGVQVLGPSSFEGAFAGGEFEITVGGVGRLEVSIAGAPGSRLTLSIDGVTDIPPAPTRAHDARVFDLPASTALAPLAGATVYHGTYNGIQGGAGYRIEVPSAWNGVLVMWAHGFAGTGSQLVMGIPPGALRSYFITNGFAWGASSFSTNYYDVRAGLEDTNELALRFEEFTGLAAPTKYYVAGISMGGHIAGAAVELETHNRAAHKVDYAGAVPICGVMGDVELYNYFLGYNVAAYELAGMPLASFPIPNHEVNLVDIKAALWNDYATDPGDMTAQGEKLRNVLMHLSGGPRPIYSFAFPRWQNLLLDYGNREGDWDGIFAGLIVNTGGIEYQLDANPALSPEEVAFNNDIFRILGDYLAHNPLRPDGVRAMPIVAGRFEVPVVTMHTLGDLFVPFSMQQIYRQRAAANGSAQWLVQRAIRAGGHCAFTAAELVSAFEAMVNWEVNGVTPDGDNVLDPTVVAHPSYGCTFTVGTRGGLPACP